MLFFNLKSDNNPPSNICKFKNKLKNFVYGSYGICFFFIKLVAALTSRIFPKIARRERIIRRDSLPLFWVPGRKFWCESQGRVGIVRSRMEKVITFFLQFYDLNLFDYKVTLGNFQKFQNCRKKSPEHLRRFGEDRSV